MFLLIFEDGSIVKKSQIRKGELEAANDGLVDIVHMDPENPQQYVNRKWVEIEEAL